jgi:hypothetical protein
LGWRITHKTIENNLVAKKIAIGCRLSTDSKELFKEKFLRWMQGDLKKQISDMRFVMKAISEI